MLATLLVLFALASDADGARIHDHLLGAETELRAADVSALAPAQRARRAALVAELARYRQTGRFPRNLDFAERTPYFVDDRGVRCAMAHLIEVTGGGALVARVAATANNAYIAELAGDPDLIAWLARHGLSAAEAARIQPTYEQPVGWVCGGNYGCESGRCEPAPDRPDDMRYCTTACDPASATACPIGMQDRAMTCQPAGNEYLCRYAGQTPGTPGWPCQADGLGNQCVGVCGTDAGYEYLCGGVCVTDPGARDGVCAETCVTSETCDLGLECRAAPNAPTACVPPVADTGCSTSGGGTAASLLLVVAGLLIARRRRRAIRH